MIITVNCINIGNISSDEYRYFKNIISKERNNKANRFRFIKDAYRCVFAEVLLSYCLYETFNEKIKIDLKYNKYGKPMMKNLSNFSFNISHSGDWVVVAYGKNEVGVDIEKIQSTESPILDCILNEEEKKYVYSDNEKRNSRFIEIWGAKESYIKYLGTGLSTEMNSFSVNIPECSIIDNNRRFNNKIFVKSFLYDKDYYLTICSEEKYIEIKEVTLKEIYDELIL